VLAGTQSCSRADENHLIEMATLKALLARQVPSIKVVAGFAVLQLLVIARALAMPKTQSPSAALYDVTLMFLPPTLGWIVGRFVRRQGRVTPAVGVGLGALGSAALLVLPATIDKPGDVQQTSKSLLISGEAAKPGPIRTVTVRTNEISPIGRLSVALGLSGFQVGTGEQPVCDDPDTLREGSQIAVEVATQFLGLTGHDRSGGSVRISQSFHPLVHEGDIVESMTGLDNAGRSRTDQITSSVEFVDAAINLKLSGITITRQGKSMVIPLTPTDRIGCLAVDQATLSGDVRPTLNSHVEGNSGSLSTGLAVVHHYKPFPLTKRPIVVTGALRPDGKIFGVGGVDLKAVAAVNANACAFIVPAGVAQDRTTTRTYADIAKDAAPNLQVIEAATFTDAVTKVRAIAGTC
jgi:hypothetical protein